MTTGIDVSQYQAHVNLELAKRQGVEFVIVKASGLNTGSFYVATQYQNNANNVVGAGLHLGHYYLTGATSIRTPEEQADYFYNHLHEYDFREDMLVLDNEKLDQYGQVFSDDQAARFLNRLKKWEPNANIWMYGGGYDLREYGPWPKVEATGARIWIASYGPNDGHRHTLSQVPGTPHWDMHQYTSRATYGGLSAVDANWSPLTVEQLFNVPLPQKDNEDMALYTEQDKLDIQDALRSSRAAETAARETLAIVKTLLTRDQADNLAKIVEREGRGSRVYACRDDDRLVVISEVGGWWRDLTDTADPWAEVAQLAEDGWTQEPSDTHWLSKTDFEYTMRNANRTFFKTSPLPLSLTGGKGVVS